MNKKWPEHPFKIALSFPSEDREYVEKVAENLSEKLGESSVFYDKWYEVELAGGGGDLKLRRIYGEMSELVVPFFSEHYQKPWCGLEWSAICEVLLSRRGEDSVVPIMMDPCKIPGWGKNDFHINRDGRSAAAICELIYRKYQFNKSTKVSTPLPLDSANNLVPKRTIEVPSTSVEISDTNTAKLPRIHYFPFLIAMAFLVFVSHIFTGTGEGITPMVGFIYKTLLGPFFILVFYGMGAWFWEVLIGGTIKNIFPTIIVVSKEQVLFQRRIPEVLCNILIIRDKVTKFDSEKIWWDFPDGLIVARDGEKKFVYSELSVSSEDLLIFQEDILEKFNHCEIDFRIGTPPTVRYYSSSGREIH